MNGDNTKIVNLIRLKSVVMANRAKLRWMLATINILEPQIRAVNISKRVDLSQQIEHSLGSTSMAWLREKGATYSRSLLLNKHKERRIRERFQRDHINFLHSKWRIDLMLHLTVWIICKRNIFLLSRLGEFYLCLAFFIISFMMKIAI